jgi:perosamine synthetase
MSVFSFHPVKHLATGEGGMVTTDRGDLAESLRRLRNHGISGDARQRQVSGQWHYEMVALGFNYRLTDIACALGLSQLKRLEANLVRRREIAARYTAAFRNLSAAQLNSDRAHVFRALRAENIGVNVHYIPVHMHPYYRQRFGYQGGEYPVAEAAYEQLISLPIFHGMTDRDVEDVIAAVRKVVAAFAEQSNSVGQFVGRTMPPRKMITEGLV